MARRRSRTRRFYSRAHRGAHKVSMKTRLVNTIALAIGFSPVIEAGLTHLPSGDFNGFKNSLVDKYTGGVGTGNTFNTGLALQAYGPLFAALIFKKVMAKLKVGKLIF